MTAVATWVIRASFVLAICSAWVNVCAARRVRSPLFAAIAALSVIYVAGYGWLLAHPGERAVWSEVMSGVALVAWPLVWIGPALRSAHRQTRFEHALNNLTESSPVAI